MRPRKRRSTTSRASRAGCGATATWWGFSNGLGFAGALGDIGRRHGDIPVALLFFNVGVELGQLAFIAGVVLLNRCLRQLLPVDGARYRRSLGYGLGTLAAVWFLERLPAVWTL